MTKICTKCKEAKPFSEFPIHRASLDGLAPLCKLCKNAAARLRYAEPEVRREPKKRASQVSDRKSAKAPSECGDAKACSECKETKPFTEFHKNSTARGGLASECKICKSAAHKRRYASDEVFRQARIAQVKRDELRRKQTIPGYGPALNAWKSLKKGRRAPGWVTLADFLPIYAERDALGPEYVVDHVIPLNGEFVSGLHVPANLQILTHEQNRAKGNSYDIAA